MNREEYAFAYNINGTGMSGIITMTNPPKLVCYCDEENSKTILKALNPPLPPAEGAEKSCLSCRFHNSPTHHDKMWCRDCRQFSHYEHKQQPTAEGAEEILASLIESLGEPDNSIHDHSYEIRPLTVNGKCEWWMFHNGVGSGEPLAQWLQNFATLHAQRLAEKMVEWISVKDKLPEEHEDVLCYNGHRISSHNWCKYTGQDDKWFKETFTHWGKLPKLPKS